MEHACSQCGQTVADGEPFCRGCAAPQIRVVLSAASARASAAEAAAEAPVDGAPLPPPPPAAASSRLSLPMERLPRLPLWRSALLGGLISALLMNLLSTSLGGGGGFFFLASAFCGGMFAITLLRRSTGATAMTSRQGFRVGALSGLFSWLYLAVSFIVYSLTAEGRKAYFDNLDQQLTMARSLVGGDAQAVAQMQSLNLYMRTPDGMFLAVSLTLLIVLLICLAVAGLGGLFAARFGLQRFSR